MLAFRKDTGCSGMVEPEIATRIMESIMVEGLLGDNSILQLDLIWKVCHFWVDRFDSARNKVFIRCGLSSNRKNLRDPDPC